MVKGIFPPSLIGPRQFRAAWSGNIAKVRLWLSMLVDQDDINATSAYDYTAFVLACEAGHESMVRLLVDAGGDINTTKEIQNANGCERNLFATALYAACQNNHMAIVRLLLDAGVDVEGVSDLNATPLHRACLYLHETDEGCEKIKLEMVQLLIEKGANIEAKAVREGRDCLRWWRYLVLLLFGNVS